MIRLEKEQSSNPGPRKEWPAQNKAKKYKNAAGEAGRRKTTHSTMKVSIFASMMAATMAMSMASPVTQRDIGSQEAEEVCKQCTGARLCCMTGGTHTE